MAEVLPIEQQIFLFLWEVFAVWQFELPAMAVSFPIENAFLVFLWEFSAK